MIDHSSLRTTIILVHGAWQGAWAWDTIVPRLEAAGHRVIAIDLPGNGHHLTTPADVTLASYAAHVVDVIDGVTGPIVMIGHSMGGISVSQACEMRSDRIALAIYLAAFLLPDGMSVLEFYDKNLQPWMKGASSRLSYDSTGLLSLIDPTAAIDVFYHQSKPALAAAAARRLTPQPDGPRRGRLQLTSGRYGTVPRVYIETRDDRSVHLPLQRIMQAMSPCRTVYSLDTDHAPQLSDPDALVALFTRAISEHARAV